jgi:putative FmdB family regulatory protein
MPTYDYRCETCGVVRELIQSIHKPLPESLPCPKCGCDSFHVFLVAPGVLTVGMDHKSIDVSIGKDAEARWTQIEERKAQRDKIRRETGKTNLTQVGTNEYVGTDKELMAVKQGTFPKPKEG